MVRLKRIAPALALLVSACAGEDAPTKPSVDRFEADPAIVPAGADTKLVWTVRDAERIFVRTSTRTVFETIELESVTMVRNIRSDTLFTLEAMNAAGSSFASVRVAILRGPPPTIDRFAVMPSSILLSQTATLAWETSNATEISIATSEGESILARATEDGSLPVSPIQTTTYILRAVSSGGETSAEVTLNVDDPRPEITSFTADPNRIPLGAISTLSWQVVDADEVIVSASGSIVTQTNGSGTATVAPAMTTEYELTATNAYGTKIARTTVEVDVPATPQILTFRAVPNPIPRGTDTTLEYNVTDVDRVRIFLGGTELDSRTTGIGTLLVSPPAQAETAYRLEADNDVGTTTATVVVYGHVDPVIDSFAVSPSELVQSATISASWSVRESYQLELTANGSMVAGFPRALSEGAAVADASSISLRVERTTFFELTAISAADRATASAIAVFGILESEPNDARAQADLHPGEGLDGAGRIEPGSDQDWYAVVVPADGNVYAETTDGTGTCAVDTVLTLYGTNGTTVIATDDDGGGGFCSRIDPAQNAGLAAGTYYVVVRSKGAAGDYAVAIRARGPGCGNGFLEGAEECDDANAISADGCAPNCTAEGVEEDEATGNDTAMSPGVPVTGTDETYFGSIAPIGDSDFYAVTMPDGYNLEAFLTVNSLDDCPSEPRGALALYAPDGATLLASDDDSGPSNNCGRIAADTTPAALRMPGGTYFLRVSESGDDAEIPTYFLHLRIVPAGCGNGLVEPGEACDDGDQTSGDGCDSGCQWEIGPTITPPGGTTTVMLSEVGGAAIVRINLTINGQSIEAVAADAGGASCDGVDTRLELRNSMFSMLGSQSGNGPAGAAGECARLVAGVDAFATDLAVGTYYLFVRSEGGTGSAELNVAIRNPACGNGIREARANEHCDDDNIMNGDGCSSACLLEGSSGPEMEPNNTQLTSNPTALIGLGTYTVVGQNTPSGDDDVFSFAVPVGPQLRFTARTYSMVGSPSVCDSNLTDTRMLLERAGFETTGPGTGELAYNDDRDSANNVWCSQISNHRLGPGTYYLRVQGWNDTQVTSYLLDMVLAP
jgi:cysteine-rich repeat protein